MRRARAWGSSDAWADDATALTPATLKTLVKVARDIYPHDFFGDSYYITAIKPWDGKAAKDPGAKSLINDGVRRLDQEANDRHKVPYAQVQWEADRVALLQRIEQTAFFQKIRGDLVVSLGTLPAALRCAVAGWSRLENYLAWPPRLTLTSGPTQPGGPPGDGSGDPRRGATAGGETRLG